MCLFMVAPRSVLMLDEARVGVGRIEEVFGPIALPFYALRWAPGPGEAGSMPAMLCMLFPLNILLAWFTG